MNVGKQALIYSLHGARKWFSNWKANHLVVKPDWLATAGDNWYRMGIIHDKKNKFSGQHLTRLLGSLITFSWVARFGLCLWYDSFTHGTLQYVLGDHLVFVVNGRAAWLYLTAAHLILSLYGLLFYLFFQTNLNLNWFDLFDQMKSNGVQAYSLVADVALRKKCFVTFAVAFKHVIPMLHLAIFIYSLAIVNGSVRSAPGFIDASKVGCSEIENCLGACPC